jgi:hypothetical protein
MPTIFIESKNLNIFLCFVDKEQEGENLTGFVKKKKTMRENCL